MNLPVRLLLADDHPAVRLGIRTLLLQAGDFVVVGEASDGREALRLMRELAPDVVLMDIAMPGLNGIEATRRARRLRPAPKVIIVSMHSAQAYVREALAAGASGYVLKNTDIEELERAIRAVARGERWLPSCLAASQPAPQRKLTSRQREVLQLVAEGRTTREIAGRLHVSLKTVETHRANLMQRLGIHDVAGLTRYALREGLIANEG